jgi:hypothetical protein
MERAILHPHASKSLERAQRLIEKKNHVLLDEGASR